jgi:hypothetical protein
VHPDPSQGAYQPIPSAKALVQPIAMELSIALLVFSAMQQLSYSQAQSMSLSMSMSSSMSMSDQNDPPVLITESPTASRGSHCNAHCIAHKGSHEETNEGSHEGSHEEIGYCRFSHQGSHEGQVDQRQRDQVAKTKMLRRLRRMHSLVRYIFW